MWKIATPAALAAGLVLAAATGAPAQIVSYPTAYWPYYTSYGYPSAYGYPYGYAYPSNAYGYGYPSYSYWSGYPGYNYYYGWPYDAYSYNNYPAPKSYWDPYVQYRPYSDNAGPKASTTGGF